MPSSLRSFFNCEPPAASSGTNLASNVPANLPSNLPLGVLEPTRYEQFGIKGTEENADATAMWFIKSPQDYSVVVASNVFGDILSDEAAVLTGRLRNM